MGQFLKLLEAARPQDQVIAVGKWVLIDALRDAGVQVDNSVHAPKFTFVSDGTTYEIAIRVVAEGNEEEAETLSPEDEAVEQEGRSLQLADRVTGKDPGVMRTKRELGTQMTQTMGKLSQGIRNIKI